MLQTCKLQDVKQEYEDLLFDNFSILYQTMKDKGHIPEELYNCLNFPPDTNYAGDKVDKPDNISQDMRHRAKILSHSLQRTLRQKKEGDALLVVKKKTNNELILRNEIANKYYEAMVKLFVLPLEKEPKFVDLPIDTFAKLLRPELRAFLHVRLFDTGNIPSGRAKNIPAKKGKLEDAKEGEVNNLIRAAYANRNLPIQLTPPKIDANGDVIITSQGVATVAPSESVDHHRLIVDYSPPPTN